MPTIYDVAERAGVSIATVSAVLNRTSYVSPELTKRVKQAVQELDYTINHLAHSLQKRKTLLIDADLRFARGRWMAFFCSSHRAKTQSCSACWKRDGLWYSWVACRRALTRMWLQPIF